MNIPTAEEAKQRAANYMSLKGALEPKTKKYSEEEVIELLQKALTHKDNGETGNLITAQGEIRTANFYSWFEQFKKNNMKEETLEEFIQREGYPEGHTQDIWETGVRDGIAWQQEQILQFLYSEITERRPYSSSKMCEVVIEFIEQNKKK